MEYFVAALVGLLLFVYFWKSKNRKLPPGPWGLPVVGYLPFLTEKPYVKLQRLAKTYGDVFSVRLGSHFVVVLNDFGSTKDAFSREDYIARPPEFSFMMTDQTIKTGAFLGPPWKHQRRFSLHTFRDLGFGKTKMEVHLQEEIKELLKHFQEQSGKPFSPRHLLSSSMSNNVSSLVFGKRFDYSDPVRKMMNHFVDELTSAAGQASWRQFVPWLKKLLETFAVGDVSRVYKLAMEGRAYLMKEIEEHEKTLDPENIRDYIDGYLLEAKKRGNDPAFSKYVLLDMVNAFFNAGSETVRISIEWLLLLVAQYQKHQRRVQAEIDDVIGRDRPPTWQDQKSMPFTAAFIMEMQRWRTLVPINLIRVTLADSELGGYFIPKDTRILSNLWSVHHNPSYWGKDAEDFKPERFLTEDGSAVQKLEHYIPFSIGKRSCPGEPLANIEVFLYFTSIMQHFDIRFPDGQEADFESVLGATLRPRIQDIIMTERS